ncbi:hypothetical protein KDA23_07840 [Candidatus Saccharibacteria bacterium]|nr:hypothetical protein [Candidatus Saccharibacteria bacterium]
MSEFIPLLIPATSFDTVIDQAFVTLSGYAVVFFMLAVLWNIAKPSAYSAVVAVATFLSLAGSAKVLPMFGVMPVSGGSFYFPMTIMALALAHRQFGNVITLNIVYGGILGLLFISLGYARWFLYALTTADTISDYQEYMRIADAGRDARDAMLAMVSLFLGGFFVITIKQWLAATGVNHPWRFFLSVGFVILFTTPVFVIMTVQKNPVYDADYWGLLFNTYVARYSILWPVVAYMWLCGKTWMPGVCKIKSLALQPHVDDADFPRQSV